MHVPHVTISVVSTCLMVSHDHQYILMVCHCTQIAGSGKVPHPCIGAARRMPVQTSTPSMT